ncbi:MAG: hypothetical protein K2Q03_05995 [Sphingobacteriaceae bacterium]|nr:hypothetical protein [Sphingobacteriaceae bacterium]
MTEKEVKELGFELSNSYTHNQYNTNRYKKGCLQVEFTYEGKKMVHSDLMVLALDVHPISIDELKTLCGILLKKTA